MALVIKPLGFEQTFTTANNFATNTGSGATMVRIINTSTTASYVLTIANTVTYSSNTDDTDSYITANLSILPLQQLFVQKLTSSTITCPNVAVLGVAVAITY